jgi:hypothetical protein
VKLLDVLKSNLILEISDKIKKQLLSKWSSETQDTPEKIFSNIDLFEKYKNGLPADRRDIMRYSYDDLTSLIALKESLKTVDDIFTEFKKKEKKLDNNLLKKYIKKFLEIQSGLPKQRQDILGYKFLDLVKMIDEIYPKALNKVLIDKFTKENPNLTIPQVVFYIDEYINIFDEIPVDSKGSDKMSFSEFEHLIDSISAKKGGNETKKSDISDIELKYNQNNLKIFAPKTKDQCIKLRNGRSWCTSREGGGNMYYNYRLGHERTLYYVIDEDMDFNDLNFASVILVDPNGQTSMADKSNTGKFGGSTNMPWSDIVAKVPKLKGLQNIFVPNPLTQEEKDLIRKVEKAKVGDNPMESFDSPQEVEMWLEYNSPRLTDIQYSNLTTDLKKKYIALGMDLTSSMIENSESEVLKYYISKKIEGIKTTKLDSLSNTDISLLNTPMLKLIKKELKSKFIKEISSSQQSGKKIQIDYPSGPVSKFIALYGFDDMFDSLPENMENLLFINKSNDLIDLKIPDSISRFKNLESILLEKCVSEIPESIGELKKINFLSFPNNPKLKTLPKSIMTLPILKFINATGCNLQLPEGFDKVFNVEEGMSVGGFYVRKGP